MIVANCCANIVGMEINIGILLHYHFIEEKENCNWELALELWEQIAEHAVWEGVKNISWAGPVYWKKKTVIES